MAPATEPRKDGSGSGTRKLSYRERLELEGLPGRIETLEAERARLAATLAGAEFYKESPSAINGVLERAEAVGVELDVLYQRWDELDSKPA